MSAGYEKAIRAPEWLPHAQVCFDPFHVVKLAGEAVDKVGGSSLEAGYCACSPARLYVAAVRAATELGLS